MEIKKFLLYSIAPAIVAGLFSVAPIVYEQTSEPKASLTFKIVDGPKILVDNAQQQVTSITLKNNGSKPLNSASLNISFQTGTILTYSTSSPSGLKLEVNNIGTSISASTPRMLESESFSITLLTKTPNNTSLIPPVINARSNETLGTKESISTGSAWPKSASVGASLAAISVFFMSAFFQAKNVLVGGGKSRTDMIFYIAIATNTESLIENGLREITYMRYAELLLKFGSAGNQEQCRNNAISALKCLLLLDMHNTSREIAKRNLKLLMKENYDAELAEKIKTAGKNIENGIELRDLIDRLLSNKFKLT